MENCRKSFANTTWNNIIVFTQFGQMRYIKVSLLSKLAPTYFRILNKRYSFFSVNLNANRKLYCFNSFPTTRLSGMMQLARIGCRSHISLTPADRATIPLFGSRRFVFRFTKQKTRKTQSTLSDYNSRTGLVEYTNYKQKASARCSPLVVCCTWHTESRSWCIYANK